LRAAYHDVKSNSRAKDFVLFDEIAVLKVPTLGDRTLFRYLFVLAKLAGKGQCFCLNKEEIDGDHSGRPV
jgi:hypothetical protein